MLPGSVNVIGTAWILPPNLSVEISRMAVSQNEDEDHPEPQTASIVADFIAK